MSVFNVPVTIGVDEDKIAKEIESEVKEKVFRNIGDKVEEIITDSYRSRHSSNPYYTPLKNMVERAIKDVLTEKEDMIIDLAATKLADKLARSKAVKEKAKEIAEGTL